jgi:hypothetical protein
MNAPKFPADWGVRSGLPARPGAHDSFDYSSDPCAHPDEQLQLDHVSRS